jgi:hypothetical protein
MVQVLVIILKMRGNKRQSLVAVEKGAEDGMTAVNDSRNYHPLCASIKAPPTTESRDMGFWE